MADVTAAMFGGALGCMGPILAVGTGYMCGCSPDSRGTGIEVPRQPVGTIAMFGALICASSAAFGALAFGTVAAGVAVGAVASVLVTSTSVNDMLHRREMLSHSLEDTGYERRQ
mmetsp:Transcript_92196/g.264251  ORF Transcript_92196/g.264251 Transcript_92196/m.264251 type:complete len:114 (-) Transcript_92196:261-602(-)|eukprot:CAMPEP_0177220040 /NCGR_PEP_ID=MMETSP0367-20130122/36677_1 /TAXON_ID=447022 ORGANISM="Scrippsiella hangoei-like, Strain SHHI-4" /NCGR_SAMPLE_ID=MMETSP0367 /ASSEMBLY_ACC=CAM_ASM_000362 /LENGTH=113 /DNA_ID=CAMNT_0018669793 /DNA_START=72 /DNA_END=413 /DNA_ORIENTATION=-